MIFDKSVQIKQLTVVEAHGILLARTDRGIQGIPHDPASSNNPNSVMFFFNWGRPRQSDARIPAVVLRSGCVRIGTSSSQPSAFQRSTTGTN